MASFRGRGQKVAHPFESCVTARDAQACRIAAATLLTDPDE